MKCELTTTVRFIGFFSRGMLLKITSEQAGAYFPGDWICHLPYVRDCDGEEIVPFGSQFKASFENLYIVAPLSELDSARLAFLPLGGRTAA